MFQRIPIRIRTVMLVGAVVTVAAVAIGGAATANAEADRRGDFDRVLSEESAEVFQYLSQGGTLESFFIADPHAGGAQRIGLLDIDGTWLVSTEPPPPLPDAGPKIGDFATLETEDGIWRENALPLDSADESPTIVVALSTAHMEEGISISRRETVAVTILAIAVVSLAAWVLTDRLLKPIEDLRRSAAALAGDHLGRRLPVPPARDEVRLLAETFNDALDQIDEGISEQRRFIAAASHELRTPIARLMATVELAMRPIRTDEEVRDALGDISEHVQYVSSVADSMLSLLTSSKREAPTSVYTVRKLVADVLATLDTTQFQFQVEDDVLEYEVRCEPTLVTAALANLVTNALRYGEPPIHVTVSLESGRVVFAVSDQGSGIHAEEIDAVLRPFARGASAAGSLGAGLGLSIVAETMKLHDGLIDIQQLDPGCRVSLVFPAASAA